MRSLVCKACACITAVCCTASTCLSWRVCVCHFVRITGIEPISSVWKTENLPLIYIRVGVTYACRVSGTRRHIVLFSSGSRKVFAYRLWWEESPNCFVMQVNDLRERSQGKCYSAFYGMKCIRCMHRIRKTPLSAKHSVARTCEPSQEKINEHAHRCLCVQNSAYFLLSSRQAHRVQKALAALPFGCPPGGSACAWQPSKHLFRTRVFSADMGWTRACADT